MAWLYIITGDGEMHEFRGNRKSVAAVADMLASRLPDAYAGCELVR